MHKSGAAGGGEGDLTASEGNCYTLGVTTATEELTIGSRAPSFDALDDKGRRHRLADYKGKTVVLYFYPKDNTPGCTVEACDFRDHYKSFLKKGAVVLGVSPDSAKSHAGFKTRHELPFPLLADEDKTLCKAYGVWQEKTLYGRKFMGVMRSTFVIGPDGKLKDAVRKVKVDGHVQAMLEAI